MQIIKEKYEIEETLGKRVKNMLMFLNLKGKLEEGNIINISKTNLAYIEPHKLKINDINELIALSVTPPSIFAKPNFFNEGKFSCFILKISKYVLQTEDG